MSDTARSPTEGHATALLDAEAACRALLEQPLVGVYLISDDRLVYANDAMGRIFGYETAEMLRVGLARLVHPDDWPPVAKRVRTHLTGEAEPLRCTFRGLHRDGTTIYCEASAGRIINGGRPAILGTLIDATERRRAEERARRHLEGLAVMRDVDMAIAGSLDLRVALDAILDRLAGHLRVDAAVVLLFNPRTNTLEYAAGRGFRTPALKGTRVLVGEGHAGRAVLERRTVHIPNLSEAPGLLVRSPLLAGEGFVACIAVPLVAKGQVSGVLEVFHRAPLHLDREWLGFLESLAGRIAVAIDNATLFSGLQRANVELAVAYDTTLEGWSRALDLRDRETEGHTARVTELTLLLARDMGMSDEELVHVRRGALLHDIGKMGIPDSILHKPGPLTEEEWEVVRMHPVYAYTLLSPIAYLRPALDIPYFHHERWDGTGYPRGLKGEEIPLAARVFAVADVWDALRSNRPYRPAWTREQALAYIREQPGRHFDPRVAEAFLRLGL